MRVIKKINNNIALCIDDNGNSLIAFGKGIGFKPTPYELEDLSLIEKTFYNADTRYLPLIETIPEEIMKVAIKIDDFARRQLKNRLSVNTAFTLADHIQFAIIRKQQGLNIAYNRIYEIKNLYETEYEIGKRAIDYINKVLNTDLPNDEVCGIALHYINAQALNDQSNSLNKEKVINDTVVIIENSFDITINKQSFNYARFASHIEYLIEREQKGRRVTSENIQMYDSLVERYPQTSDCVNKICDYYEDSYLWLLNEEEKLYLILHVNRLISRQDCYR